MAVLQSPGVQVVEKDFTTIIPQTATSIGGIAGRFNKGPFLSPVMVTSEDQLYAELGGPDENNFTEWFTAAEFLKYSNKCWVVRAKADQSSNSNSAGISSIDVPNSASYDFVPVLDKTNAGTWIAKAPGTGSNGLQVIMVDALSWAAFKVWSDTNKASFPGKVGPAQKVTAKPGTSALVLEKAGSGKNDEVHIFVIDTIGKFGRKKNTILEVFQGLSKCADAKDSGGKMIYYPDYINNNSGQIYFSSLPTAVEAVAGQVKAWGSVMADVYTSGDTFAKLTVYLAETLGGGDDGTAVATSAEIQTAYDVLANVEDYDVNLIMTGAFPAVVVKHVVENVVLARKDCIAFTTPHAAGIPITGTATAITEDIITYKNTDLGFDDITAQYAVMDTGFKYVNDKYNNKYRWVPLNGDLAGLCARTDQTNDAWWSPAGYNRGGIKNALKLSFNPEVEFRDLLYQDGVNPVISTSGSGTILFGDKTMTSKPSAFDRINVRRLFNLLEKAIAISAKYQLFEFNDAFTRAQFKGMVEPFLRNIQSRRGITDFLVICDESNNNGTIIDSNQFIAEIYIKPARSINFITLEFVATSTGVEFSTVVGG